MNTADSEKPIPGLQIDTDWKAAARAEKEKLAQQAAKPQAAAAPGSKGGEGQPRKRGENPPANFQTLVSTFITQAMFALGMIPDPQTGRRVAVLDLARHHIDMLGVLEEKTKGNLSEEETKLIATALYELRMQYVNLSQQAIREQIGAEPAGQ